MLFLKLWLALWLTGLALLEGYGWLRGDDVTWPACGFDALGMLPIAGVMAALVCLWAWVIP